jgi:hypothetical protein
MEAIRSKYRSNPAYASASARESFAMFAASRSTYPQSVSPDPSGNGTK